MSNTGQTSNLSAPPNQKQIPEPKYDEADLEEFCIWLYGLFEQEAVESK